MLTFHFPKNMHRCPGLWSFQYSWKSYFAPRYANCQFIDFQFQVYPHCLLCDNKLDPKHFSLKVCSACRPSAEGVEAIFQKERPSPGPRSCTWLFLAPAAWSIHGVCVGTSGGALPQSACRVHTLVSAHIGDFTSLAGPVATLLQPSGCGYPVFQASDPQQHPNSLCTPTHLGSPAFWRAAALFPGPVSASRALCPSVQETIAALPNKELLLRWSFPGSALSALHYLWSPLSIFSYFLITA